MVCIDGEWTNLVTDVMLTNTKHAKVFKTREAAQKVADTFNEAIVMEV